jgi:hypothetical protein
MKTEVGSFVGRRRAGNMPYLFKDARVFESTNIEELRTLSPRDLHDLAYGLVLKEPFAVEKCVAFVVADSKGMWHGRGRAMMCRRLKHCQLNADQRRQLVICIMDRLVRGNFSEQFYDQLRLAMHLDRERTFEVAHRCQASTSKSYVRRYANWILGHEAPNRG